MLPPIKNPHEEVEKRSQPDVISDGTNFQTVREDCRNTCMAPAGATNPILPDLKMQEFLISNFLKSYIQVQQYIFAQSFF